MNLKKADGQPFFQIINCFQICAACLKLERVKQINCTHIKSTAHWLSSKKIRELKLLYKASPEDAIREFGGVVVSDYRPALRKEEIAQCFAAPLVETTHAPKYIFTACDPNGGGPSHMSIVSGYFSKTGDVVVSRKPLVFLEVLLCQVRQPGRVGKVAHNVHNVSRAARPVQRRFDHFRQVMLQKVVQVLDGLRAPQVAGQMFGRGSATAKDLLHFGLLVDDEEKVENADGGVSPNACVGSVVGNKEFPRLAEHAGFLQIRAVLLDNQVSALLKKIRHDRLYVVQQRVHYIVPAPFLVDHL
jgi:hypothetical protein